MTGGIVPTQLLREYLFLFSCTILIISAIPQKYPTRGIAPDHATYYDIISCRASTKIVFTPRPESGSKKLFRIVVIAIMILKDNIQDANNERTRNYLCLNDQEKDVEINQSIIRLRNHIYYTLYVAERELRSDRIALKEAADTAGIIKNR